MPPPYKVATPDDARFMKLAIARALREAISNASDRLALHQSLTVWWGILDE